MDASPAYGQLRGGVVAGALDVPAQFPRILVGGLPSKGFELFMRDGSRLVVACGRELQ